MCYTNARLLYCLSDGCVQVLLELLTGLPAHDQRREDHSLVRRHRLPSAACALS